MSSFQISITPSRRAAARFVAAVRRELQKVLTEENTKSGLTQSDVARTIGVHRSVINREIRGFKDITLGRLAELAFAMGRTPQFALMEDQPELQENVSIRSSIPESDTTSRLFVLSARPRDPRVSATSQ
ncbi:MAG: helix-turn-helix domain-containing protein [Rhizobiales bacterium]|nr:helix-turn-helix domain-containing protein [Hyphomicrobiales bacterium]MBI3672373.1 helix-turn-helix domain-containing protein [Hyphomicrobiales bacterium]